MKKFLEFIAEMPQISTFFTKEDGRQGRDGVKEYLKSNKSTEVAPGVHHSQVEDGRHLYFNKDSNGDPKDVSIVSKDNKQVFVSKGSTGPHDLHKIMHHHVEKHGELITDGSHTKGSKKLWLDWVKTKPNGIKFEVVGGEHPGKLDHNNIDEKSAHIWGASHKMHAVHIKASRDD